MRSITAVGGQRHVERWIADRAGSASVEFALLLPLLSTLVVGMIDYTQLAYQSMEVGAAAHAGADYALHSGFSSSGIAGAVTAATGLAISASPAPLLSTACVTGGAQLCLGRRPGLVHAVPGLGELRHAVHALGPGHGADKLDAAWL